MRDRAESVGVRGEGEMIEKCPEHGFKLLASTLRNGKVILKCNADYCEWTKEWVDRRKKDKSVEFERRNGMYL